MKLSINDITKIYGKQKALDSVSFSIQKGELLGFLGPNGAGKSTLMKIVTGYLPATSGEVWIDDKQMTTANTPMRKYIGYLPELNPLYTDLYVRESLDITAGFYGIKDRSRQVSRMVEMTGLGDEQHKKIGALSKGFRQRVGLAQALIHDPQLLILDEPTTGLDPNQLEDIRNLIRNISREKTVILSSHIMQEVEAVCSRVVIINKGQIVADGSISEIKRGLEVKRQQVVVQFDRTVSGEQLKAIHGVWGVNYENDNWILEAAGTEDIRSDIFRFAVENDLIILTMMQKQQNLEGIFQQLTKGHQ